MGVAELRSHFYALWLVQVLEHIVVEPFKKHLLSYLLWLQSPCLQQLMSLAHHLGWNTTVLLRIMVNNSTHRQLGVRMRTCVCVCF